MVWTFLVLLFVLSCQKLLWDFQCVPSAADLDLWIRPAVKPCGFDNYEMVMCYVDDICHASHNPMKTMSGIQHAFKLKDDKIAPPDIYLGANLEHKIMNGHECLTMSSEQYVKAAVANIETKLLAHNKRHPSRCDTPSPSNYRPEIDITPELKTEGAQGYPELIGILRWAISIGRIDILTEVAMMSTFLASPRSGHLVSLFHVFGYL